MRFHGDDRHAELGTDLLVQLAAGHERHDLTFAQTQRRESCPQLGVMSGNEPLPPIGFDGRIDSREHFPLTEGLFDEPDCVDFRRAERGDNLRPGRGHDDRAAYSQR
jgi:hypothetical protein